MFLPYKVDVPMARLPWANWGIILVTVVISVSLFPAVSDWHEQLTAAAMLGDPMPGADGTLASFILQPGQFRAVQLVGNLLTHDGWVHLLGNMLFLWVFGNAVNAKIGQLPYLLLYFGAGILEGLVWLVLGPHMPTLGASGAIMSVVGAFLLLYPLNDISCLLWILYFVRSVQFSAGWLIGLYAGLDLYGAVFSQHAGVAYLSHVTGFMIGAGAIGLMLWKHWLEPARGERTLLQVFGWMPEDPEAVAPVTEPYLSGYKRPVQPAGVQPVRRPPPKPRDESPIPLD